MDPDAPGQLRERLTTLHELVQQGDSQVVGSAAWEAQQQANVLNAGSGLMRRNARAIAEFNERAAARGMWMDAAGDVHIQPVFDSEAIAANVQPRQTKDEWAAAEGERMREAWERPKVRDELFGKRNARAEYEANLRAAEAARQASGPEDYYEWQARYAAGQI